MLNTNCLDSNGKIIDHLTQWDINQKLIIVLDDNIDLSIAPEIHFCNKNSKNAIVIKSTISENIVIAKIPNSLLTEPFPLLAYVYLTDKNDTSSKKTIAFIKLPIRSRKKPDEYISTDEDIVYLESIIEEVDKLKDEFLEMDIDSKIIKIQTILDEYDSKIASLSETQTYLGI